MSAERPPFEIDREVCVGHGRCYALAPQAFYPDEMGRGHVNELVERDELPPDPERIARACPEGAIRIIQREGEQS